MRTRTLATALVAGATAISLASAALAAAPTTDDEKALYSMGAMMSRSLAAFDLSAEELEFLKAGLTDAVLGNEPAVDVAEQGPIVQKFAKAREERMAAEEKKASEAFLAEQSAAPGASKTDSGLMRTRTSSAPCPRTRRSIQSPIRHYT
jgi:FKBP-type peptidyl-prolyl cis-trans isomerase FkpA